MEKNENGDILLSGEVIGKIDGFLFKKADNISDDIITDDVKSFVTQQLEQQIDQLINEGDAALRIEDDFTIRRKGAEIARLKKTDDILAPDFDIHVDPLVEGLPLARLALHVQSRIKRQINLALDPLEVVRKTEDLTDDGKAFVEKLISAMGYLPRQDVDNIVRAIQPEERSRLRKAGIRFAQYGVFVRDILKPMAQATKIILWALHNDFETVPALPPAGVVSIPYNPELPEGYYNIAGYRICGDYVVRADMIEKLADSVRAAAEKTEENPKGEFEITPQHMSYVGKSGDIFTAILKTLGYDYRTEMVTVISAEVKPQEAIIGQDITDVAPKTVEEANDNQENDQQAETTEVNEIAEDTETANLTEKSQEEEAEASAEEAVSEEVTEGAEAATEVSVTETQKEKQIWFWAGHKKKPSGHNNKKKFKKKESDGKNSDKKHASKKGKFNGDRRKSGHSSDKNEKQENQPYVNMPGKHKVTQENNPFAALLNLKK